MNQFARPRAPRSTVRLLLSPQPTGISDLQGWCLGLLSIGLVVTVINLPIGKADRLQSAADSNKQTIGRNGTVLSTRSVREHAAGPSFSTVSATAGNRDNKHEDKPAHGLQPASQTNGRRRQEGGREQRRRRIGSSQILSLNIKAGAENPPRIGGSGLKVRTMTISCYGYKGDHTNVKPLGGYKWDPDRLACAIRGGKIGDSVRIEWKKYSVVALIWDHLPGSRLDSTPGLWRALGGGTYGLKKGAKVTFLGRVK